MLWFALFGELISVFYLTVPAQCSEVHIVEDSQHQHHSVTRPRAGSIVKRSRSGSNADIDEFEMQKGALCKCI